jgi:hypothetical protein
MATRQPERQTAVTNGAPELVATQATKEVNGDEVEGLVIGNPDEKNQWMFCSVSYVFGEEAE